MRNEIMRILVDGAMCRQQRRANGATLPEIVSNQFGGMIVRRDGEGNVRSVYISFERLAQSPQEEPVVPPVQSGLDSIDC